MADEPLNPLTAKLNIPDMPGLPGYMPKDVNWENIKDIWKFIEEARESRDPAQWDEAVGAVKTSLQNWRKKENKWQDLIKQYRIAQAVAKRAPEGEKRQKALDAAERIHELMPPYVRKAADDPEGIILPAKVRLIDQLLHQLEGIRQADFDAYHSDVQGRIRKWQLEQENTEELVKKKIKKLYEHLDGVKDETKRRSLINRINDVAKDLNATEDPGQIEKFQNEIIRLRRFLTGATTPAGRAKIQERIDELKAELKTPDEMQAEQAKKTEEMKYDALIWLATIIAHPIKVIRTQRAPQQQSLSAPYMPHKSEEEEQIPPGPPPAANECRIFFSLISEGRYDEAKSFCLNPYIIDEGSLVTLTRISDVPVLNGLQGRVRFVEDDKLVVDLFKNDKVVDTAVKVSFYEAEPYL
jgi:hypothetical protein